MKIRKSVLQEALKVLGKVVAQTSPGEVVRSVRFVGDGGRLRLMATDGVECVALRVEREVAEAVDFADWSVCNAAQRSERRRRRSAALLPPPTPEEAVAQWEWKPLCPS